MLLFIRDRVNLDPAFFWNSETLTAALDGYSDFKSLNFLSFKENIKYDQLDIMEDEANVEVEICISKDQ